MASDCRLQKGAILHISQIAFKAAEVVREGRRVLGDRTRPSRLVWRPHQDQMLGSNGRLQTLQICIFSKLLSRLQKLFERESAQGSREGGLGMATETQTRDRSESLSRCAPARATNNARDRTAHCHVGTSTMFARVCIVFARYRAGPRASLITRCRRLPQGPS